MTHEDRPHDGDAEEARVAGGYVDPFATHVSDGNEHPVGVAGSGEPRVEVLDDRPTNGLVDIEMPIESPATGHRTAPEDAGGARFVVHGDGLAADRAGAPESGSPSSGDHDRPAADGSVVVEEAPATEGDVLLGADPVQAPPEREGTVPDGVGNGGLPGTSEPPNLTEVDGDDGETGDGTAVGFVSTDLPLPDPAQVAEVVAATGLIAADRLAEAVALAGGNSLAAAITETVGGPAEVAKARAKHYGVPFVNLAESRVNADALETIPFEVLNRVIAVPYALEDGKVLVAVADPGDVQALDELRLASKLTVRLAVAVRDEIEVELKRIARAAEATERSSLMDVEFRAEEEEPEQEEEDLSGEGSAPIARLFASILQQAASDGASDVHLDPTDEGLLVRFRIDGVLHEIQVVPSRLASSLTTLIKVMAKLDIAERRKPQDGRITMTAKSVGRELDVRVAILPTVRGECCVMRLLDTSSEPPTLEILGFAEEVQRNFEEIVARPTGALLVTGPTGSGKSTTLYATLAEIHRPEINVITVEDPVEYRLSGLQQVQINKKAGLTFAAALRSILRADPDVIMVGEIRDAETAKISVESALTGHLVLSTLHTNDAPSAITRLTEMGVEPFLVGAAVSGVIAQRLARRLCDCKESYAPTEQELDAAHVPDDWRDGFDEIYRPAGCARCGNTGYKGRVGVYQLMVMSDEMIRLTSSGGSRDELEELARTEGMKTLWEAGLETVIDGRSSFEELRRVLVS